MMVATYNNTILLKRKLKKKKILLCFKNAYNMYEDLSAQAMAGYDINVNIRYQILVLYLYLFLNIRLATWYQKPIVTKLVRHTRSHCPFLFVLPVLSDEIRCSLLYCKLSFCLPFQNILNAATQMSYLVFICFICRQLTGWLTTGLCQASSCSGLYSYQRLVYINRVSSKSSFFGFTPMFKIDNCLKEYYSNGVVNHCFNVLL